MDAEQRRTVEQTRARMRAVVATEIAKYEALAAEIYPLPDDAAIALLDLAVDALDTQAKEIRAIRDREVARRAAAERAP